MRSAIFDAAVSVATSTIERLRLSAELVGLVKKKSEVGAGPMGALQSAKLASQILGVLSKLGVDLAAKPREDKAFELEGGPEPVPEPRKVMAGVYNFDPNRKTSERRKDNTAAVDILRAVNSGDLDASKLTDSQKAALARYSGTGGNLVNAETGKKGSAYEYYTPKPIAEGMWSLLAELGFAGGKVLDPCAGVGIFGATAPASAAIEAVELNEISGQVNQLVNGGPGYNAIISPFEAVAARTPDESYDAVVSNVPFGSVHDRGANRKLDPRYQDQPLENYFILRSLEKLKPGGLAAFIVPPRVVSAKGGRSEQLRVSVSYVAEFVGAYRLPNSVFGAADADTITDVIVLRKFSRDAAEKVAELREQNPALLVTAKVQWTEFISGDYFKDEGRRFVLGEFQAKDPSKFRDVDRVISTRSVADIAKLLRKFPRSRIDWAALNAAETQPIVYNDGDTMAMAGQTLEMRDGVWVPIGKPDVASRFDGTGQSLSNAAAAVANRVDWPTARGFVQHLRDSSQDLDMPDWLRGAERDVSALAPEDQSKYWSALCAGLAVVEVTRVHGDERGFNYAEEYPAVHEALASVAATAKKSPASMSPTSKQALTKVGIVYDRRQGYSAIWMGQVSDGVLADKVLNGDAQVEAIKYRTKGITIPVEALKEAYGEDFDPYADDEWCLSADGSHATKADDYFSGNLGAFLERIDAEIAAASGPLRDKLLRQKAAARDRVSVIEPSDLRFNLFSPFVSMEEKAEFLRRFLHPAFVVGHNEDGEKVILCDISSPKNERERQLKRFAEYLKRGNLSTRTTNSEAQSNPQLEETRRKMLRELSARSNAQFDQWVKANPVIMSRLRQQANDPARAYFRDVDDTTPLQIDGMSPDIRLHGYQNAEVRKRARSFGGINGFDVGLGKAQPLDAKILTPNGWVRMGDVRVGDMVIAVDGTSVPVTGVYPQGEKEIFEVEFSDGARTRCCDEHLWWTNTESDRKIERYNRRLGRHVPRRGSVKSLADIRGSLTYQTQRNHQIPLVSPVQFPEADLPVRPYIIGVLLGDGGMTTRATTFTTVDESIAARVAHLLDDGFGDAVSVVPRPCQDRAQSYSISRRDPSIRNCVRVELERYGIAGKRSHEKFIPDAYLRGSVQQRIELLRGLMDTDGYVSKDGMTVQFTSTSHMLADGVKQLVQSLGGIAWIRSKATTFKVDGVRKSGRTAYNVSIRMPVDINPFHLQRKADRVNPKTKYLPVRYITAVRSIGNAHAQCISIEHPDHLYVTDDYIVTHNTFTALACAQYVHSIGVKKKTFFVVPNSVLSNWRREASRAYASLDDCLFVGLDVDASTGDAKVSSGNYARDFNRILENRHAKIFCTLEAFKTIPLKDATVEAYGKYLSKVDPSYEGGDRTADSERADSKLSEATDGTGAKSSAIPFFEDMGVDSLVLDEAHMYKNSKQTVEFSGAKYLSVADASQRGLDLQIKAWFVRGRSPLGDGVLALTATPITNSPLEIYSMLTLAVGEQKVHDLIMGARGADEFMEVMCDIEDDEEPTIDGRVRPCRVFRGLQNVTLLREAMSTVATIKSGADVKKDGDDMKLPDAPENKVAVQLTAQAVTTLNAYKIAYRTARYETGAASKDQEPPTDEERQIMEMVAEKFGEPLTLIAHPFNLISKMTAVIADPELDERATFYRVLTAQADLASQCIAEFNKKDRIEVRRRPGPWTDADAIAGTKTVKDGEAEVSMVRIRVRAKLDGDRVVLDTLDTNTQADFEAICDRVGLDLDCSIPPKFAALLENVRREEASPRNPTGRVKQLIFCDLLGSHNKIKRLLVKHCGYPASAIAIVSGQTIKNPEQMQGIQDGFNAEGEDNKYRIVIANEKAEVGVNYQKGTQAIHHLTIGWTPDSIHQRNGRGVRQGNTVSFLNIYHYDADGTFDTYKRSLTNRKGDWIGAVMDRQGGNDVAVSGGLTNEQYDEMIGAVGDAGAMEAIAQRAELKERAARSANARARQLINLQTAAAQDDFQRKFSTAHLWIREKALKLYDMVAALDVLSERLGSGKLSAASQMKLEIRRAELEASVNGLAATIDASMKIEAPYGVRVKDRSSSDIGIMNLVRGESHYKVGSKIREHFSERVISNGSVVAGGELDQEWQSEVAAADAMKAEALRDFERIAKASPDAFPAQVVAAYKSGQAAVIDGQPIVRGLFVRDKDGALIGVTSGTTAIQAIGQERVAFIADALSAGAKLIMFGTPEYQACVEEAAKLEDALGEVQSGIERTLFSYVVPEVSQQRKKPVMVRYSNRAVKLPSPAFMFPVDPADERYSEALRAIGRAQTMVNSWDGSDILVDAGVSVESISSFIDMAKQRVLALADKAKAEGTPLTMSDYAIFGYDYERGVASMNARDWLLNYASWDAPGLIDKMRAATSDEELNAAVFQGVHDTLSPFLVIEKDVDFGPYLPRGLSNTIYAKRGELRRAAELAQMQESIKAKQEQAAREAEDRASGDQSATDDLVQAQPVKDASRSGMVLSPWVSKTGERRVYFNKLPGATKQDNYYATDDGHGLVEYHWPTDAIPERRDSLLSTIQRELAIMNDGEHLKEFSDLLELAGIQVDAGATPDAAGVDPNAIIGLTGQTKKNIDLIKRAAMRAGGRAVWLGKRLQWNVPAKAWEIIIAEKPEAAQELQTVPA